MIKFRAAATMLKTISLPCVGILAFQYSAAAIASEQIAARDCRIEAASYFNQELAEFDQAPTGWRGVAEGKNCIKEAADLIHDYREHNELDVHVLYFHEAQLRLSYNAYRHATLLLKKSFVEDDIFGWNPYVSATIAFVRRDLAALERYRAEIMELTYPEDADLVDLDGKPVRLAWPPNIKVVNAMIKCFDKSYEQVLSDDVCVE